MKSLKSILIIVFTVITSYVAQSQSVSQSDYQVIEELDVKVPMRDGIRLSTNIYRPDATGKFPAVLIRSPYGNGGKGNKGAHFMAQRGYVMIVQDVRGRSESEGEFYAMRDEAKDGYDMQQWVGEQTWCNGKIGTSGGSYVGYTQWMPAPKQSPYLKTMVPSVTFSDLYNTMYQNGVFYQGLFTPWSIEMTRPNIVPRDSVKSKMKSVLLSLPLVEQPKKMGWKVPFLSDYMMHSERDVFWEETSVGNNYDKINVSVCNIGGWYDILLKGTINNYQKMTDENIDPEIRKKQKLIIGPWVHSWGKQKVGELDFGEEASFKSQEFSLRWYDSQLKGIENGIMEEPPIKIFVMGDNTWRYENEWPLARTNYQKYYFYSNGNANTLNGDGKLSTELVNSEITDQYTYNPADPVWPANEMGPYDQTSVEERADVLVYTTPTLQKDVEVTGPVKAVIYASSSAKNTDFTAKLVDVYPDGRAMRICEGIIRASHRNAEEKPTLIEPGKVYEYNIDLWATSNVFKAGHQIRLEISSSNFPRFSRNLNTGHYFATDTTMVKAKQIIYHNNVYPSHIVLPVIKE